jgi:catechol 2,3-dioxygenase-like lactoylglutathione lyase family enzyme
MATDQDRPMSAIKPRGVVHFSIPVSDLEASKAFYTELLGLRFVAFSEPYQMVFMAAGQDHVILCKSETPIRPNAEGKRRVHHAFAVEPAAYDDAKAFLQENGVAIFDEEDRKSGVFPGRQFYIHDPDRNVIEFSEWSGRAFD